VTRRPLLIADDEPVNLSVLRRILAPEHELVFARSGLDCLAAARKHRPALILLDVQMPDLDGHAVCRRLKADPQTADIPVIFVSALSETGDEAAGFECGAVDYIAKPVSPPLVRARVRTHLSLVQASTLQRYVRELEAQQLKVRRLSRFHELLSGINSAIVRLRERQTLFDEACRIAVQAGGFAAAWIALREPEGGALRLAASQGLSGERTLRLREALAGRAADPCVALARQALTGAATALDHELGAAPGAGMEAAHRAAIALPLTPGERPLGVLVLCTGEAGQFDDEELKLLGELAGDIAFALNHIEQEERLLYLSRFDALTGLPNHPMFMERLALMLQAAAASGSAVVVVVADVHRFKRVNDALGRHVGDQLLKQLAQRLESECAPGHGVARLAADGFAVAGLCGGDEAIAALLRQLDELFARPARVESTELSVSARFGLAVFPGDGEDAETLFRNAEAALKQARQSGDRHAIYSPDMNARMNEKLELESQLRLALERQEFELHYQPKVDLRDGRITGAEALIRWRRPDQGLVPPGEFIPVAEESGLIVPMGAWVLEAVCAQQAAWRDSGLPLLPVAVNLSALQFRQGRVRQEVAQALQRHGLAPRLLELELTETLVVQSPAEARASMDELRGLGLHLSLDDFGTGYSSLAYLRQFPFDSVKIDRAFVTDITRSEQDAAIALAIIAMAHSMGMRVIAEGVETVEQARFLSARGCDQMQGYYFSRPLPAPDYARLLAEGRRLQGVGKG